MDSIQVLIHVRFAPDGTVMEIGERPKEVAAQEWFGHLSRNTQNSYQVLSGGRGIFRLTREQMENLKQPWQAKEPSCVDITRTGRHKGTGMTTGTDQGVIEEITAALSEGTVIPYLGPGIFQSGAGFPANSKELVDWLCDKISVPGRMRNNLTAVGQYIENFKHRKTLTRLAEEAFTCKGDRPVALTPVHRFLAALPRLPLVVDTWYDGTMARTFSDPAGRARNLCQVSGVSRSEHPNEWVRYAGPSPEEAHTVLYKPYGSVVPEPNFLISDADYVEVLTEIDIQTPIPPVVQRLRTGRRFLFLGCRFNQQLDRIFARQIMKRSSDRHWVVLDEETTPKEARFLAAQNIMPIRMSLKEFIGELTNRLAVVSKAAEETVPCKSV